MKIADKEDISFNPASKKGHIASVAVSTPPYVVAQAEAKEFLMRHFSGRLSPKNLKMINKIFGHPSVLRRYFAFENPEILLSENSDSRIARFTRWAVELSEKAIVEALAQAGLSVGAVTGLVVNTCTGYLCPGLSSYLIERLGLRHNISAYDLVGAGCGGAIPNLEICEGLLRKTDNSIVLSVSVEICSATFQMADDPSLIISNALFADGAAASVLWNRPKGLELVASANRFLPEYRDAIRYVYKHGQLHNQLSSKLPQLVNKAVSGLVFDLLEPRGLKVKDIEHWALHAGGEKIIDAIKNKIGLSENQISESRNILAEYGNMSSASVWFVLRKILDAGIKPRDWCIMISFGAGLSAYSFLLREIA